MADLEKRFIVYVITPDGEDYFDFEMMHVVTEHEKRILDTIPEGMSQLMDNEELAILYTQLEQKAYEEATQKFWDKNPDAPDEAFNDYQVIVDL